MRSSPKSRILLALAVAVLLSGCAARATAICGGRVLAVDKSPPATTGEALVPSGKTAPFSIGLESDGSKLTVVNFWASWCGPCRSEMPMLAAAARELSPTVSFLGIDIRDDRAAALAFIDEFAVPFPSIYDREAAIAAKWGLSAPPGTFVLATDGRIVAEYRGEIDRPTLDCMIEHSRQAS